MNRDRWPVPRACFDTHGGVGIDQDFDKALYWYKRAIENGHSESIFNLGTLYENGQGVEKDIAMAIKYYKNAKAKGVTQATEALIEIET